MDVARVKNHDTIKTLTNSNAAAPQKQHIGGAGGDEKNRSAAAPQRSVPKECPQA